MEAQNKTKTLKRTNVHTIEIKVTSCLVTLVQTKDKIKKDGGREGAEGTMKTILHVPQSICCGMGGDGRGKHGQA
jgi:hypothetical protein